MIQGRENVPFIFNFFFIKAQVLLKLEATVKKVRKERGQVGQPRMLRIIFGVENFNKQIDKQLKLFPFRFYDVHHIAGQDWGVYIAWFRANLEGD